MENNFKTIKDSVDRIIFESHNSGDKALTKVWNNFISEVRQSPVLKTLYVVYNNIENNKFADKDTAEIFLNENIFSFGSFTKKEIISESEKLMKLLSEHAKPVDDDLFHLILESTKDRKLSNLHIKAELFNKVATTLVKEEVEIVEESPKIDPSVVNRAITILNEKYSFFNERERGILNAFLLKDEDSKEEYYNTLVKENVNLIRRKLVENDGENQEFEELLEGAEKRLLESKYTNDTPISRFSELIEFPSLLQLPI